MALGTITVGTKKSNSLRGNFINYISVPGDAAYTAGGTTGVDATIKAALGDNREVCGIVPMECAGYLVSYSAANGGTLKMYRSAGSAAALAEVPNGNYSATTLILLVISK